jgi:hypothetical protein
MRYVGMLQYASFLEAREFYDYHGYKFVDAPWTVGREAILLTRPPAITGEPFSYVAGGDTLYPVASAEQSFLQIQMDAVAAGKPITGSYQALTPCFRNEAKLDDLHQPYFMKLELIHWVDAKGDFTEQETALHRMVATARRFFEYMYADMHGKKLELDVVVNRELAEGDPIGVGLAFDIQTSRGGIEIGSYGIREQEKVGRWIFGTGLAEPRFSYACETEEGFKTATGRPS